MKKSFRSLIVLILLAFASGCAAKSDSNSLETKSVEYKGDIIELNKDMKTVINKIGKDYKMTESKSCMYNGYDREYEYKDLLITTYPKGEKDYISSIIIKNKNIDNFWGISIGESLKSALSKVESKPKVKTDNLVSFEWKDYGLSLYVNNNEIEEIEIWYLAQ
jgi:hypothetical protein